MPSLEDIARLANVSKMTVSNVINKRYDKVSEKTRIKIENLIEQLNYTPNLFARSLKSHESKIVMLAIPQTIEADPYKNKALINPFYGELINSIEYNLRKLGYYLMFRFISEKETLKQLILNWNVDGVIVLGAVEREMQTIFKDIDVPSVFLDSYIENDQLDLIITDDEQGGYLATEHLIQTGRKNIGIVLSSLEEVGVSSKRFDGYKKALKKYGLTYTKDNVFEGYTSYEFGLDIGKVVKEHISTIDGLFVYSDIMALSVMKGLNQYGIRVPEDVAIVGFDGLFIGELAQPSLTTIKQDITLKGEVAVNLLNKKMQHQTNKPEKIIMPVQLVQRKTT
jgi:LacI family transcriptional regulator